MSYPSLHSGEDPGGDILFSQVPCEEEVLVVDNYRHQSLHIFQVLSILIVLSQISENYLFGLKNSFVSICTNSMK